MYRPLSQPRHPMVDAALDVAQVWCRGHIIDQSPAIQHALRVATVLGQHVPHAPPQWLAAALVHDGPFLAPAGTDVDQVLTHRLDAEVARIVREMHDQHTAMDTVPGGPPVPVGDAPVLHATTADKIVALSSMMGRAAAAADRAAFWQQRAAFRSLLPYFCRFAEQITGHVPDTMRLALASIIDRIQQAVRHDTGPAVYRGVVRSGPRAVSRPR